MKKFRKALAVVMCVVMTLTAAPLNGFVGMKLPDGSGFKKIVESISAAFDSFSTKAQAETYSGTCGENLTWSLDTETGVLNITGTGAMEDYTSSSVPWDSYIKTVNIGDSVTTIGSNAFYNCDSLTSVTIPDSVTTIGDYAFYSCDSLTSVTIPDSVTNIGKEAFVSCKILTIITVDENNKNYSSDSYGVLFNKDKTTLIQYPKGNTRKSYVIPDSVTTIGDDAFYLCSSLTSVTIPNSVKTIGNSAFSGCRSLASVTIGNSVTSIGEEAFWLCPKLASITISNRVTEIGYQAFYGTAYYNDENNWYNEALYIGDYLICAKQTLSGSYKIKEGTLLIGDYAFYSCDSLTSVTIPDSVTTIGDMAFSSCDNLTIATIPDSVTGLGYSAFAHCKRLESVTISNKVTTIGDGAFYECTNLKSVKIPDGVTTIGDDAFYECYNLTSVTIPDSVITIGDYAFYFCDSLTSVTIPDSVITIGDYAFCDCYSLTSATIGNSVTTIGDYAFCVTSLTKLIIGDSVTTIGDWAFFGLEYSADVVYYVGTQEQWKKISIGSYNDGLIFCTIHYNYFEVPKNKYVIKVVDSSGKPIEDAQVSYGGKISETGADGTASFIRMTSGNPLISVEKKGYHTYSNENTNYTQSKDRYEIITLYSSSEAKHLLKSAKYFNNVLSIEYDVLIKTKRVSRANSDYIGDFDDGKFSLFVSPISTEGVTHYCVYQGKNRIAYSENGNFENLNAFSFDEGGDITVRVYSGSGYVATPINLIICDDAVNENARIEIGKSITIKFPDNDIPYVGGTQVDFDFPALPIDVYLDKETVHVGFNVDLYKTAGKLSDKATKEEKKEWYDSMQESIDDIKETVDGMKKLNDMKGEKLSKDLNEKIKNLLKEKNQLDLPASGKIDISFCGYGEGILNEKGLTTVKAYICIIVDVSAEKNWQTFFGYVPIVLTLQGNIKGELGVDATVDLENSSFSENLDINYSITSGIEASIAAGVGKIIGIGVYGSADMLVEISIVSTTAPSGLNKIDLTGELGLKGYIGPLEVKKPFAHKTWPLYTRTKSSRFSTNSFEGESDIVSGPNLINGIYDINSYSLADTNYLKNESEWLADETAMPIVTQSTGGLVDEIRPMITETYRNAQPVIATNGTDTVMAFVGADTTRTSANIARVMYSVYNNSNNKWSTPVQLDSNGTFDSTPYIYSDGTDIWIVYCDSSKVFDANITIDNYATSQIIKAAKFNTETGSFDAPVTVAEAGGKYISMPEITVVNSVPTVIWQENTNADILGTNNTNEIHYATFNGTSWSSESVAASGLNSIVGYAVGDIGGKMKIAYMVDGDNNLETIDDRKLFIAGNSSAIDSGTVSNPVFAVNPETDKMSLFWFDNGGLSVSADCSSSSTVLKSGALPTDRYEVIDDRIVFIDSMIDKTTKKKSTNLFSSVYSSSGWSNPVQVTKQTYYDIDHFDAVTVNGRPLAVMTQRNVKITDNNVDDSCTLSWAAIGSKKDVAVKSVNYSHSNLKLGQKLPLNISVENYGDTHVSSLKVKVYDESNNVVLTENVAVSLPAGSTANITVNLPMFTKVKLTKYKVEVQVNTTKLQTNSADNPTAIDETTELLDDNTDNNFGEVTIGYTNFEVVADYTQIGNKRSVVALVTNNSYTTSDGKLYIYSITDEEKLLATLDIDELEAMESQLFTFDISEDMIGSKECVIEVVAEATVEGQSMFDNRAQVSVDFTDLHSFSTGTIIAIENSGTVIDDESQYIYGIAPGLQQLSNYVYPMESSNSISYTNQGSHIGTGSQIIVKNTGGNVIATYTAIIYGDVNGDGWYDAEDAFLVNLIANGLLTEDKLPGYMWTAADCNHDGVINEFDVELLMGAGVRKNDIDQNAAQADLVTQTAYIEYASLIDQSAGMYPGIAPMPETDDAEQETTTPEINETVEPDKPAEEMDFEVFFANIFEFIKKILSFIFSFII